MGTHYTALLARLLATSGVVISLKGRESGFVRQRKYPATRSFRLESPALLTGQTRSCGFSEEQIIGVFRELGAAQTTL